MSIKSELINKWRGNFEIDKKLKSVDERFDKWLDMIPLDYRETVIVLLRNFEYFSSKTVNKHLEDLHQELIKNDDITDLNTVYAYIKSSDGKSNSSNNYWYDYKKLNEIDEEFSYEDLEAIKEADWKNVENVVFIDDFSGTGKSFIEELEKNKERYVGKNIFFITVGIMEEGFREIVEYGNKNRLKIIPIYSYSQDKAFRRNLFEDDLEAQGRIRALSEEIGIPERDHMGYGDSQTLIAFYQNTPNNTLGFIRYDVDTYESLFPRRKKKTLTPKSMSEEKSSRKEYNYNNIRGNCNG